VGDIFRGTLVRWQCNAVNSDGYRCENEAIKRLHFSSSHPFDHTDVCMGHFEEFAHFVWVQDLHNDDERKPC
jgi:hypothetical protein